jgi:hypothetical protein
MVWKCRRSIVLICCHIFWLVLQGQTFNSRFDVYQASSGTGFSVENDNTSQILVFFNAPWSDTLNYSSKLGMLRLGVDGQALDTVLFPLSLSRTYAGWSDASFIRPNGGMVVAGLSNNFIDNINRIALFFFDQNGQPDSSIVVDMGNQTWIGRQAIETSDGNFLVCGEKFGGDAFIMKISPLGDVLWSWSGGGPSIDYATSVAESPSGKYYMGGAKEFSGVTGTSG